MLGSLKFAVLQFADFHFPQNPRIARTPCTFRCFYFDLLCIFDDPSCDSTLDIFQDLLKISNSLDKWGFVDSQLLHSVLT